MRSRGVFVVVKVPKFCHWYGKRDVSLNSRDPRDKALLAALTVGSDKSEYTYAAKVAEIYCTSKGQQLQRPTAFIKQALNHCKRDQTVTRRW